MIRRPFVPLAISFSVWLHCDLMSLNSRAIYPPNYLIPLPGYLISISNVANPKLSPDIPVTANPSHHPSISVNGKSTFFMAHNKVQNLADSLRDLIPPHSTSKKSCQLYFQNTSINELPGHQPGPNHCLSLSYICSSLLSDSPACYSPYNIPIVIL